MTAFAILASGPSLTADDCAAVRAWRVEDQARRRVMAINTTFRSALWADYLYAADREWWRHYAAEVLATFRGECWTQDQPSARDYGLRYIYARPRAGLCREPWVIHHGGYGVGNSGFQALNLAYHLGARRMILLGYDMRGAPRDGRMHHHPDHPKRVDKGAMPFAAWRANMPSIADPLRAEGIDVVNCSPISALTCFRRASLADALAEPMEAAA